MNKISNYNDQQYFFKQLSMILTVFFNCDVSSLLHDILSAKPADDYLSKASETQSTIRYTDVTHYPDIHFVFDYEHKTAKLYLNASKSFWMQYNNGLALRELLITHYSRVKRFSQRVFEIPLMTVYSN